MPFSILSRSVGLVVRKLHLGVIFACVACAVALTPLAAESAPRQQRIATGPLETAFVDPATFTSETATLALTRARAAGATRILLLLYWNEVAPAQRRIRFNGADPAEPSYKWKGFDAQVQRVVAAGLDPVVIIYGAPLWAQRAGAGRATTVRPDPAELAKFATAAATRYGGAFQSLPRIHAWQIWNEPNLSHFLSPQYESGNSVAPDWYRDMVNAAADAIHAVHADDIVIAGGTFPFGGGGTDHYPLDFMRRMLCMSADAQPRPTCASSARFDAWSHHPYSQFGPNGHAVNADSVSIADLPKMRRLLEAALSSGHIQTTQPLRFWASEFSWESKPPDPDGVPAALEARWVAEGLYRMWQSGISLVTWFLVRDEQLGKSPFQSGLYYYDGTAPTFNRPKPALGAYRFPFVAFPSGKRVFVWGRTPSGKPARVIVEQTVKGPWKAVRTLTANRAGIFSARLNAKPVGRMRARISGVAPAVPFALKKPPDLKLKSVFGQ
jgi:hypothetical protein